MSDIENKTTESEGTIQFSLDKTKHVNLKNPAAKIGKPITEEDALTQQEREEKELLTPQALPTEFEDVFSDKGIQEEDDSHTQDVVGIEEVFEQKAAMINENFHDGVEGDEPDHNPKLKKAAIIAGIVCGAIILAAIAIGILIIV